MPRPLAWTLKNFWSPSPIPAKWGLEVVDQLVRSAAVDLVVVDSVAALVPRAEIEGEMGDAHVGLQARLMSQALRKITGSIGKSQCTVIFLNQLRQKNRHFPTATPKPPLAVTPSSSTPQYVWIFAAFRPLKKGTEEYGIRAKVKVAKNKVAPPFRIAEFDILFGQGISTLGCLLDLAEQTGVVIRKGAWYSYEGDNVGQGRDNTVQRLQEDPAFAAKVEAQVREKLALNGSSLPVEPEDMEMEEEE